MDPDACLDEARRIVAAIKAAEEHDSDTLAMWLTNGGFLPQAWKPFSEGLMSDEAAEAACAEILENPGIAAIVGVLCER